MADENQNENEQIEFETKKPLLEAFKDLFKRPAALPGEIPSKHKTSNIDMRTSMSFREFRANIMKSVGDFFQSLSKIGAPKKEETLNKYAKEYVNNNTEKSAEKTKDDNASIVSQQPIHIPGQVSIKNVRTVPSVEHISVDDTAIEDINKSKLEEGTFESDSSNDETIIDTDIPHGIDSNPTVRNNVLMTETIVAGNIENTKDSKSKTTTKRKDEPEQRDL